MLRDASYIILRKDKYGANCKIHHTRFIVKTVCYSDDCNGCMLCKNICVKQAIVIEDQIESYNAIIDESKCIGCGRCHQSCPQNHNVFKKEPSAWYQGWALDPSIRKNSSSGGLATAIALDFVNNGGVFVGCIYKNGEFTFSKAISEGEVKKHCGSKYVKSNPDEAYKIVREELNGGHKVLFIGLPCQVAGIKSFIGSDCLADNLFTIDLICHGSPSPKLFNMFLSANDIDVSSISEISFRRKNKFRTAINGKPVSKFGNRDLFMSFFLKKLFYTENCYKCKFSQLSRCSDLTLGDSWGSQLCQDEISNGVSLVLCQTEKGISLVINKTIHLEEVDLQKAVAANTNLSHPSVAPEEKEDFFKCLIKTKSFQKAIRKTYPKAYYKNVVKEALSKLSNVFGE